MTADVASACAAAVARAICREAVVLALLGWRAQCAARRATASGGMLQGLLVGVVSCVTLLCRAETGVLRVLQSVVGLHRCQGQVLVRPGRVGYACASRPCFQAHTHAHLWDA